MFDLSAPTEEKKQFDLIPEGFYPIKIKNVAWKTSKTGNDYVEIQCQLFNCKFENRIVFHRMNMLHENENVRKFALADCKRMLEASNIDTGSLKSLTKKKLESIIYQVLAMAKVIAEPGQNGYPDKNVIKGWKPFEGQSPAPRSQADVTFTTNEIPF